MAYDVAVNFRNTAAYVTDGAHETDTNADGGNPESYPTGPRSGIGPFGYTSDPTGGNIQVRDFDNTVDRRLVGGQYNNTGGAIDFRIDVPSAGAATIHLAVGLCDDIARTLGVTILDSSGPIITIAPESVAGFMDATGAVYLTAAWPGSETGVSVTLASAYILVRLSPSSGTVISHVRIVQAGGIISDETDGANALPTITDEPTMTSVWG